MLVVDDVASNLRLVAALLEPLACEVVLASSGHEALTLLQQHEFAMLLLDVQMPDIDGYALAQSARRETKSRETPIIFLTAADLDDAHVLRGYGTGAVDFLFKPLDAAILRSKVQVFLELYDSQRQVLNGKHALERAYDELKSTQAQLVQAAKMAALGQFVAGIAHEINNPLAFVLAHLGTVKTSLERVDASWGASRPDGAKRDWDRACERLREMHVGLERIRELVVKLRTFSRLDDGERKDVSIRECVESVLMILNHRMTDRIVVRTHYGEPDRLKCFPSLLNQAILNIVGNAIESIADRGEITIRTVQMDGECRIAIHDTGPGIPAELRDRVFEPFFTTKQVGDGVGLGLAISYAIVQKHGGKLELECPDGGGTRMTIVLPLSSP